MTCNKFPLGRLKNDENASVTWPPPSLPTFCTISEPVPRGPGLCGAAFASFRPVPTGVSARVPPEVPQSLQSACSVIALQPGAVISGDGPQAPGWWKITGQKGNFKQVSAPLLLASAGHTTHRAVPGPTGVLRVWSHSFLLRMPPSSILPSPPSTAQSRGTGDFLPSLLSPGAFQDCGFCSLLPNALPPKSSSQYVAPKERGGTCPRLASTSRC